MNAQTQSLTQSKYLHADEILIVKVKQFNQFLRRFNYEEDFQGNKIDESFRLKFPRENYIGFLFNSNDQRFVSSNAQYINLVDGFIEEVVKNDYIITRTSPEIYVLAKCSVKFNGTPKVMNLILRQQESNGGLKWVMHDVLNAKFLDQVKIEVPSNFIPPTSNEVNFTHLKRAFNNPLNFEDYFDEDYKKPGLLKLKTAVQSKQLTFSHVEEMKYFVLDIKGWVITVEEYNRANTNSGWLIGNLEKYNGRIIEYLIK